MSNGTFDLTTSNGTAEGTFFLADGTLEITSTGATSSDSQIIISLSAFSRDTEVIESGDYATNTNVPDKYVFVGVSTADGTSQSVTGGTVTISGSGNTYTMSFDVPFGQGVELAGTVAGTYENQ